MPCALTTRPTTRSMDRYWSVSTTSTRMPRPPMPATKRAQRSRGAAASADHLAEVLRVHMHLDGAATADSSPCRHGRRRGCPRCRGPDARRRRRRPSSRFVGLLGGSGRVGGLQRRARTRPLTGAASAFSAVSASALAAFLAGAFFFLAVVASVLGPPSASASAALNRSSLLVLGSLTFRVPSAPGRPLNFCQSPVIFSSAGRVRSAGRRR